MLSLKKVYRDELLQLALILSLLRVHPDTYFENDLYNVTDFDLDNGTSWRSLGSGILRAHFIHPKSLDSVLLNHEREVFAELNSLGRYNRVNSIHHSDITAYLLNVNRTSGPNIIEDPLPDITPSQSSSHSNENELNVVNNEENTEQLDLGLELTQEDMDLIEVLWKQDVDLGYAPDMSTSLEKPKSFDEENSGNDEPTTSITIPTDDDIEKLKALKDINENRGNEKSESNDKEETNDPWAGVKYTIDTETGEYVIKGELDNSLSGADCGPSCDLPLGDLALPLPEFLLEEALQLVGLDDDTPQEGVSAKEVENINLSPSSSSSSPNQAVASTSTSSESSSSNNKDIDSEDGLLTDMIQTSQFHHPHHRAFQSRMPFGRTISMEQRWQDLANLLSLPSPSDATTMPHPFSHHHPLHNYSHPHTHGMSYGPDATRGVLLHNATLTPPMGDLNGTVPYSNIGGTNLGNAVATSMNLTNSSEPMGEPTTGSHYKIEPSHDMIGYYQNTTSELNQTDGFLSSILNDEDLQLMDMAMNEGMYTMRMLDSNNTISNLSMTAGANATTMSRADVERMDTSSDSAVSSMGSERVPSLSDGEWCDAGSDSGHNTGDNYVTDYHGSKFRPYDYSYTSRQHSATMSTSDANRLPPVAQKKHQMFGKRCFQEQTGAVAHPPPTPIKYEYRDPSTASSFTTPSQAEGALTAKMPEMKYSCSVEFGRHNLGRSVIDHIQHNHTYHLPVESTGAMQRPVSRDKIKNRKSDSEHLTRDEKRARALNVPITVDDIINLPMDEFNERLSKYDLSEPQLSLIRDIRRRGKNKVAAQNCRKRKLDQILSLADEVRSMRDRKMRLVGEFEYVSAENKRVRDKYQQLYRHVFQNLRDPDGNQYSPFHYSLQITADGSILVVPKANSSISNQEQRKDPPPPPAHKE